MSQQPTVLWTIEDDVQVTRFSEAGCTPFAVSVLTDYFPTVYRGTVVGIYNLGIYSGYSLSYALGNFITLANINNQVRAEKISMGEAESFSCVCRVKKKKDCPFQIFDLVEIFFCELKLKAIFKKIQLAKIHVLQNPSFKTSLK